MTPTRPLPRAALNAYVTAHHEIPNQPASVFYATTVTARELTDTELGIQVAGKVPEPIQRTWHRPLTYPSVSGNPEVALGEVAQRYANCDRCHLSERRTKVVIFRGSPHSPVVFLADGPSKVDDAYGYSMSGPDGKLEEKLLESSGIRLGSVGWITLVGCRPCDNRFANDRMPNIVEKAACSERTLMLFRALRPSVVVCLGAEPTSMFLKEPPPPWTWTTLDCGVVVGHARHPAYLLRRLGVQGGEAERVAALNFYGALRDRMPHLTKLPSWPVSVDYLSKFADGRIATH